MNQENYMPESYISFQDHIINEIVDAKFNIPVSNDNLYLKISH